MTAELRAVAERHCQGRIAVVTEGGYDLQALAASLDVVTETLNGSPQAARWPRSGVASIAAGRRRTPRHARCLRSGVSRYRMALKTQVQSSGVIAWLRRLHLSG